MRVRLHVEQFHNSLTVFQSTHSLRSATFLSIAGLLFLFVSIHALLAECDTWPCWAAGAEGSFNPRTPCGVRLLRSHTVLRLGRFQSTHSLRSATSSPNCLGNLGKFQSTHSLRSATAPDHIHCYSTAQTILCANLPEKAIIT